MFNVDTVIRGLKVMAEAEKKRHAEELKKAKAHNREQAKKAKAGLKVLGKVYAHLAKHIADGGDLTRAQIEGKDLSVLPPALRQQWLTAVGAKVEGWRSEYDLVVSRESQLKHEPEVPSLVAYYTEMIGVLNVWREETMSRTAWKDLGYPIHMLAQAAAAGAPKAADK